jgi:hypothetical protein
VELIGRLDSSIERKISPKEDIEWTHGKSYYLGMSPTVFTFKGYRGNAEDCGGTKR